MTSTLETTGGTLVYDTLGDAAETIVFVHGAGGNHLSWWQQIPHFRDRFRCVTYEVRGWGTEPGSLRRGACGVSPRP